MSWFTDIFTGGIGDVVKGAVDIFDDLHTSDEEKSNAKLKLTALLQSFEEKQLAAAVDFEKQVTERHANDMKSDSWLSKNIRPLGLLFMLVTLVLLVYLTIFTDLTQMQYDALESWIAPLIGLVGAMVTFYYGSRGMEKIKKIGTGS